MAKHEIANSNYVNPSNFSSKWVFRHMEWSYLNEYTAIFPYKVLICEIFLINKER